MPVGRFGRLLPRALVFLLLALAFIAPAAATVPTAPLSQTCTPRPNVVVSVVPTADGRLQATFTASGAANLITELRFIQTDGAVVDISPDQMGRSGAFRYPLPTPTSQTTIFVRRTPQSSSATVRLGVMDACGEWPTFVGGGPNAFPSATATPTGPTPTRTPTPTATATLKPISLNAVLAGLVLPTPQTGAWANIPAPTTFDWIGIFRPGALDRDYVDSPRFLNAQASGTAVIPVPSDLDAGTYELRLFSNKTTDLRLASSNQFTVSRPPSTPTLTPTPGIAPVPVVAPASAPDTLGDVGQHTSIRLDQWREFSTLPPRDIPVIAYYDVANTNLKLLRCTNQACAGAQAPVTLDAAGNVGKFASLQLDNRIDPADPGDPKNPFFFPVVSYYEELGPSAGRLKIIHCVTLDCSGGGHPVRIADASTANVGLYTSLALASPTGFPVVSYYDATNGDLRILVCGDVNCFEGNSIALPDTLENVGLFTSLVLAPGNIPVVSYFDATNGALKVLRCGNATCTAPVGCGAGQNCIRYVDAVGQVGHHTSIALDRLGNPVIAYYDVGNQRLKIAHCNDPTCATAAIQVPDGFTNLGRFASLALDNAGRPVVGYFDAANGGRLKVLRCDRPACTSHNTIFVVDVGNVGQFASLALNGLHNPVISYYKSDSGDLRMQHCSSPACITAPDATGVPPSEELNPHDVGRFTSLRLDGSGNPVISYYDVQSTALRLLRCGNPSCSVVANAGNLRLDLDSGESTSLALDNLSRPVISYVSTLRQLRVVHCGDANCDPALAVFSTPDASGTVGRTDGTSLDRDSSGFPVVSYYDATSRKLKVLHCINAACSGAGHSIQAPDSGADVGRYSSLRLDTSGNPVVSYYDAVGGRLKVLHCVNATCSGSGHSIQTPDPATDVGQHTSLVLDAAGNPVVSYYDATNRRLKLLHCVNTTCSGSGHSIAIVDAGDVGEFTSLALVAGRPVISYYDAGNRNLKLALCGDANCTSGNVLLALDTIGDVGKFSALAVEPATGIPFVSYYDEPNGDLRLYRCRNATCN